MDASKNKQNKALPAHLDSHEATGAHINEPIAQFEIGNYKNFVYMILDWQTKKAAIVDPQHDLSKLTNVLDQHGFELTSILLTHTHADHIAGVPELVNRYPSVPVCVHRGDLHRLPDVVQNKGAIRLLRDGDTVSVGNLQVKALHTPGHSIGECCFLIESGTDHPYLFTGDTVFVRDCGRTDFETGSNAELFQSLQRLKKLPPKAVILPGHHYGSDCASTLADEMRESAPFQCKSVDELAALP